MRIAVGSDEHSRLTDVIVDELWKRGHEVELYGALAHNTRQWPKVAEEVAERVASGHCDEGILFCWTGTGVSIAANKVPGIRAALCADAETARGARQWNQANVLAMSLRLTSETVGKEILEAWLSAPLGTGEDADMVGMVTALESKFLPQRPKAG